MLNQTKELRKLPIQELRALKANYTRLIDSLTFKSGYDQQTDINEWLELSFSHTEISEYRDAYRTILSNIRYVLEHKLIATL